MGHYLKIEIYAYMDKDASENMEIIMHKNNLKNWKKNYQMCVEGYGFHIHRYLDFKQAWESQDLVLCSSTDFWEDQRLQ